MFTLGIPLKQKRRTLSYLSNEYYPGGMKKLGQPIPYEILSSDDGFFQVGFPGMDEDEFRDITFKLKQQGVTVIGADSQLTENNIMKLVNLVPLKESLQVTTNNGKVAIISDPKDIKTFYKGGTVFGDDSDGGSIELSKETSLDFQSVTQEGSCGYAPRDEDPNEADQPAGPHLLRKKIREIIESFADDPNVPGVTGMEDAGGKVRDNIASQIPDNYGYQDLARDIAYIIQNDYGSHNAKPFIQMLTQKLQRPNY